MYTTRFFCCACAVLVAACGGQGTPGATAPAAKAPAAAPVVAAAPARAALRVGYIEYSQPDLGPAGGLHSYRALLVTLELEQDAPKNPALEVLSGGRVLGRVALRQKVAAPDGGPRYGAHHWGAEIPASWVLRGVLLRAVADGHGPSVPLPVPLAD